MLIRGWPERVTEVRSLHLPPLRKRKPTIGVWVAVLKTVGGHTRAGSNPAASAIFEEEQSIMIKKLIFLVFLFVLFFGILGLSIQQYGPYSPSLNARKLRVEMFIMREEFNTVIGKEVKCWLYAHTPENPGFTQIISQGSCP